jgi:hypothetical protein
VYIQGLKSVSGYSLVCCASTAHMDTVCVMQILLHHTVPCNLVFASHGCVGRAWGSDGLVCCARRMGLDCIPGMGGCSVQQEGMLVAGLVAAL